MKYYFDRELFFHIGRALQRGIGKKALGVVFLSVSEGHLVIESDWGGGRIPCRGPGDIAVKLSSKAFCSLITTRYREKTPTGKMELAFDREQREVCIDRTRVHATYLKK